MNLSAFLASNAITVEPEEVVASKRFIGEDGKPALWKIKAISGAEDEELRKSCMKQVPVPGKRNQYTRDIDHDRYLGKLAATCTLFPDLQSAELQDSYGVKGEEALLKTMLTSGEYVEYLRRVQEICGFDTSLQDEVDEAKN